jgi:hypothetical protein
MRRVTYSMLALFVAFTLMACSMAVKRDKVPGTYIALYPFGTDKIMLNSDGTFVQQVTLSNDAPATARGSWKFDANKSRVFLYGSMVVVDGFGNLKADWRTVTSGVDSMDVEIHWFKIVMGSASTHPYVKQ